jgi:outer membrane autotransporter protein
VGEPLYVEFKSAVTDDPPHVEVKSAVDVPLHVEFKEAVGVPLYVEVKSAVGEPLYVEFKSAVTDDPPHVEVKSAVGEPLHVEFKDAVGEPLYVEFKEAVGEPLHVEFKSAVTDDPPHVEFKSAVGEPLVVEVKSAVGEPLVVEFKEAVTGEPPVIRLPETGTPLYVIQYAEVDGDPPVVYIGSKVDDDPPVVIIDDPNDPKPVIPIPIEKAAVGEPLVVYVRTAKGEPLYVLLVPEDTPEDETTPPTPLPDTPPTVSGDQPVDPLKPSDVPGETPDPSPLGPTADPEAAPETTAITNGRLAALAFAGARGTWLADHSYESANIILSRDLREDDWTRAEAPFAGIDGAWLRVENDHSHIKIDSVNVIAGYAVKTRHEGRDGKPDSSTLLGAFLDFGHGGYTTYDHFTAADGAIPDIHGDGTLRAYGVGVMARKEWENGFRLEGSLRAGKLENEFSAGDYLDANGVPMSYETDTPYYGAHVGVGRTFKLDDPRKEIDLRLRYYWDKQGGETVTLPNGEIVEFLDDDSHRLRFGARFTHEDEELRRWYIGAAVEHEFAGKAHARTVNFDLPGYNLIDLRSESLEGTTGIAELGVDIRPYKGRDFSIATGIQGYFGKYRGVSGGIRLEWEF